MFDIVKLTTDTLDDQSDAAARIKFGTTITSEIESCHDTISPYYHGFSILDLKGLQEIKDAIVRLRHLFSLYLRVEATLQAHHAGSGNRFGGPIRSFAQSAEKMFGDLSKTVGVTF